MLTNNDTMKQHMRNIGECQRVTTDEEAVLAVKIANGDEEARQNFININQRLVVKIAHDFEGLGLPLRDLISIGNLGLKRAVEKFDPSRGSKLFSCTAWWIKLAMRRAIAKQSKGNGDSCLRCAKVLSTTRISKIQVAKAKLANELGREPTDREIAKEAGLTERTVTGLRLGHAATTSRTTPSKN